MLIIIDDSLNYALFLKANSFSLSISIFAIMLSVHEYNFIILIFVRASLSKLTLLSLTLLNSSQIYLFDFAKYISNFIFKTAAKRLPRSGHPIAEIK